MENTLSFVAFLLFLLAGCASGPSTGEQAVPTFDPNYNPNDPAHTWRVPATNSVATNTVARRGPRTELVFKKIPTPATMEALLDAGAVKVKGTFLKWVIESSSIESRRAVTAARREGAVVTRKQ